MTENTAQKNWYDGWVTFLILGILFGVILIKSEVASWFRIQEMFRFQSIHMYGIIGTAVIIGAIVTYLIKRTNMKSIEGKEVVIEAKENTYIGRILGGTVFGFGWAMTGACPGPLYTLLGHGIWIILVVILSALLGTFVYGLLKSKLPH